MATDIYPSIIIGVRNGTRTRLQKRTEKKILAVTTDLALDRALIDAAPTWRRINEMLAFGTAQAVILDFRDRPAHITPRRRNQLAVRTAARIEGLHQRLKPVVPDNVPIMAGTPERRKAEAPPSAVISQNGMGHTGTLCA